MRTLWQGFVLTILFVLVTGLAFPAVITAISQATMPYQANGSLVKVGGNVVGSALIGQSFAAPKYVHPRPSAAGNGYDAANSSGTNLGPTSDKLINGIPDDPKTKADESYSGIKQLAEAYRKENGLAPDAPIPADAVTRSGSGLDPHISIGNAHLQVARIAKARGKSEADVQKVIDESIDHRFVGLFGDPGVNVLKANLALDQQH